jgi:hypothetical protein
MMTSNSLSVKHQFGTYSRKNEIKRIVFVTPWTSRLWRHRRPSPLIGVLHQSWEKDARMMSLKFGICLDCLQHEFVQSKARSCLG